MTTSEEFDAASQRAQQLPGQPANAVWLRLYGFYKQATEGDLTSARPRGFDCKAIAKHDAWASVRGTSEDAARALRGPGERTDRVGRGATWCG